MFLQPKKTKFKKVRKGKLSALEFKSNALKFGTIGIKSVQSGIINSRQIEACRQAMSRKIKKKGKIWIRIFPDVPITSKSVASRMGKGKGSVSHWGARVRGGTILFELCGVNDPKITMAALRTGQAKLPVKTRIVK